MNKSQEIIKLIDNKENMSINELSYMIKNMDKDEITELNGRRYWILEEMIYDIVLSYRSHFSSMPRFK